MCTRILIATLFRTAINQKLHKYPTTETDQEMMYSCNGKWCNTENKKYTNALCLELAKYNIEWIKSDTKEIDSRFRLYEEQEKAKVMYGHRLPVRLG